MKDVVIYTDGACSGNPGPGGWGAVLEYNGRRRELKGGEPATTNNRMELMAAIQALAALRERCQVLLYTDSNYVRLGITEWLPAWKARGWKTAGRAPVKNVDLWQQLDVLAQGHDVVWRWVKGHSGDANNDRADELARSALMELPQRVAAGG